MRLQQRLLLGLATFFLGVFIYQGILRALLLPAVALPGVPGGIGMLTVILMLFSFFHATYTLGWRHNLTFFALSAVISWAFEQAGVATGLVYGAYHYTDALGPKLGHVPFLIPIAWFMMIYPSYIIANLIAQGKPTGTRGSLGRVAWLAFLSGMVMTAWDLVVDPGLSGAVHRAWVWEISGPYFGVPTQNFVGWLLTTFTVYLCYRLLERRFSPHAAGPVTVVIAAMPVAAYGAMMLSNMVRSDPPALVVVAPFAMGLPLIAAIERLWYHQAEIETSPRA
jgi:putative membrane protein